MVENIKIDKINIKFLVEKYCDYIHTQRIDFDKKQHILAIMTNIEVGVYSKAPQMLGLEEILIYSELCNVGEKSKISKDFIKVVISDFLVFSKNY